MIDKIKSAVESAMPRAALLRHAIHSNPELSFCERGTAKLVCDTLSSLGVEYVSGVAGTGVVAKIGGDAGGGGKTVLIRADMDALPVSENTGLEFSSKNPGVMHACGHDMHTAILLCTAIVLSELKEMLSGRVILMFQPGEETSGGAKPMIESGALDIGNVDSCIALHVEPSLNVGQARFKAGAAYACPDEFCIKIKGKSGHAAAPHRCIDPIVTAAQVITALQAIPSRMIDPMESSVLSVCSVSGGSAYNVIPGEVVIGGTARTFSSSTRDLMEESIGRITAQVCAAYGAEFEYKFDRLFPPLINDEETIKRLKDSAANYLSSSNIFTGGMPTMAGEDFSYLTSAVKSSALFWLGSTPEGYEKQPLHSESLVVADECIRYGTEIFADYTIRYLSE